MKVMAPLGCRRAVWRQRVPVCRRLGWWPSALMETAGPSWGPPLLVGVWLAWRELGVGGGRGEVGGGGLGGEADHRAVDIDTNRAVGGRLAGGWVETGQQVGPGGGQVEHDVLVDLAGVEAFLNRLGGPQAELGVPQRAVGVGVPGVFEGREVAEHIQQV